MLLLLWLFENIYYFMFLKELSTVTDDSVCRPALFSLLLLC